MRTISSTLTAFLLLGACTAGAFADEMTTYAGTLGKANIIVELQAPGKNGTFFGRYAYMIKGIDIPLHGTNAKGGFTLEEEKPCTVKLCRTPDNDVVENAPIGAEWSLKPGNSGETLEGTWTDKDSGRSLPIKLVRKGARAPKDDVVAIDMLDPFSGSDLELTSDVVTANDLPYDFFKLDYPMKKGKVVAIGDSAYRMDLDSRVGLDFPTVVKLGKTDPAMLNRGLMDQRLRWVADSFGCFSRAYLGYDWSGSDSEGTNGFDDGAPQVTVDYLTPRLMGITESGSQYCGGAHPDNFETHILVDARTGKSVTARNLLNGFVPKSYDGTLVDPADVDDPTTVTWGPDDKLMKYVLAHRNESGASEDPDCQTADLIKTNLGVYFKGDKLILALVDLPNVTEACAGDLSSMPIKDARPFLTKAGAAYFAELDK